MDLERYRKDAKALLRAFRAGDGEAAARAESVLGERGRGRFQLSDAQHVVAVEHGYRTWPELKRAAETSESRGPTPLEVALYRGARETAERLAENEVSPLALWTAAALGRVDLLRRLDSTPQAVVHRPSFAGLGLPPGPPPGDDEQTILDEALCFAALNGRDDAVEWLLERGADVDGAPYLGVTPLCFAVQFGRSATVKLLLDRGADPTLRDRVHGATPAEWARRIARSDLAGLIEGIETGLEYTPVEPVRLRVDFRRFPYVLDDGRAVELAGRPSGWREVAERIARERIVNVSRAGVVSLPVVAAGPGFDVIVERIARASLELYLELLELSQ